MILIDIETAPRPDLVERYIRPLGPFDADAVKYGNTKDPAKRKLLLATKEAEHDDARAAHFFKARAMAALDPLTAEIVVIGVINEGGIEYLEGTEREVLEQFWHLWRQGESTREEIVSWSGNTTPECFDPMMIIKRSWACGLKVPQLATNGRYLGSRWEDATTRYLIGKFQAFCALTRAADELGLFESHPDLAPKAEGDLVTGKDFHLWYDGKADSELPPEGQRELALSYLRNDLLLLQAIVERIY